LQGLKPDDHSIGFTGLTEVMPLLQSCRNLELNEFFRGL
jgi:hypothetical protein